MLEIIEIARANDLELIFVVAPSHGYADYYYDSIKAWGIFEQWLLKLSGRATSYSFSQSNEWVSEPISPRMAYWNDTFHFSLAMGQRHSTSLAGLSLPARPDNFMERLTPDRRDARTGEPASGRETLGTSESLIRGAI